MLYKSSLNKQVKKVLNKTKNPLTLTVTIICLLRTKNSITDLQPLMRRKAHTFNK